MLSHDLINEIPWCSLVLSSLQQQETTIIGKGGFRTVYRGDTPRQSRCSYQGFEFSESDLIAYC